MLYKRSFKGTLNVFCLFIFIDKVFFSSLQNNYMKLKCSLLMAYNDEGRSQTDSIKRFPACGSSRSRHTTLPQPTNDARRSRWKFSLHLPNAVDFALPEYIIAPRVGKVCLINIGQPTCPHLTPIDLILQELKYMYISGFLYISRTL